MPKKIFFLIIISFLLLAPIVPSQAAPTLSGRILLQVEDKGQAWYVYPVNYQRYYLGTPSEAFNLMRQLGLGISNSDFNTFEFSAPLRLRGRILIKVQDLGKAYYVDPLTYKMYYLGRPQDAFNVMRARGLGITNADLLKIVAAPNSPVVTTLPLDSNTDQKAVLFSWKYKNKNYSLEELYSKSLYNQYVSTTKILTYPSNNPPANPRDSYYGMLVSAKSGDTSIDKLITDLKALAATENYQGDQLIEFILAFVQYIPYDHTKILGTSPVNYPYETLYKNSGVCSDKTFLADLILRRLNYGAIIFDFPDANHSAVGIECPTVDSTFGSGYCYVETTNYFPVGVLPQVITSGVAGGIDQIDKAFDPTSLGQVGYFQKTSGLAYNGMSAVKAQIEAIKSLKLTLDNAKIELDALLNNLNQAKTNIDNLVIKLNNYQASGDYKNYNDLLPAYNTAVNDYNNQADNYQAKVDLYNLNVIQYNQAQKDLFQSN